MHTNNYDILLAPLVNIWSKVGEGTIYLFFGLILFAIGVIIAKICSRVASESIKKLKIDSFFKKNEFFRKINDLGYNIQPSLIAEFLVKWIIIIASLLIISEYFHLTVVSEFFFSVIYFIFTVIVSIAILIMGIVASSFVKTLVSKSVQSLDINKNFRNFLPILAEWSIIIFSAFAALNYLDITGGLLEIFFAGFVFAVSLAVGIAFGFGGRDHARRILDNFLKNIEK